MAKLIERDHPKYPFLVRIYEPKQTQKGFATRKEAEAYLAVVNDRDGKVETFRDYALRWNAQTAPGKREPYVRRIESYLQNRIFPAFGDMPLDKITREMCKDLLWSPDLTPSVAYGVAIILNSVLNEAVRDKRIRENPARDVRVKYNGKREHLPPVTFDQLEVISDELGPWGLALWLQYGAGLRIGEALSIRADSVLPGGEWLRVEEQVNFSRRSAGEPYLVPMKYRKPGDFRDIPLPTWLRERIDKHVAEYGTDGYLFPEIVSGRSNPSTYYRHFNRGRDNAGVPELTTHMLRHYYASVSLANKVPITDLSRWLGHKNIQLTFDTYSHMMPSSASEARSLSDDAMNAFRSTEETSS